MISLVRVGLGLPGCLVFCRVVTNYRVVLLGFFDSYFTKKKRSKVLSSWVKVSLISACNCYFNLGFEIKWVIFRLRFVSNICNRMLLFTNKSRKGLRKFEAEFI